jgi:hypothetical protein
MILEANIVDYAFELTRSKSGPDLRMILEANIVDYAFELTRSKSGPDLRSINDV